VQGATQARQYYNVIPCCFNLFETPCKKAMLLAWSFFIVISKKVKRYILALLVLNFMLLSCRELVQDEFNEFAPTPVINSIILDGSPLKVNISYTGSIDADSLKYTENAEIDLFIDGNFSEKLLYIGGGAYSSQGIVNSNQNYACQINIPNHKLISCNDFIPKPTEIRSIKHLSAAGVNEEGEAYPAITFTFSNNPNEIKYYEAIIRLFKYGYEVPATLEEITNPIILNEGVPLAVFSNKLITDTLYEMTINYTTGQNNGQTMVLFPFILELRSISYNYYQYKKRYYLYEQGRYPDGISSSFTVFNLHSNIENGYGIFAGYSVCKSDTIYP